MAVNITDLFPYSAAGHTSDTGLTGQITLSAKLAPSGARAGGGYPVPYFFQLLEAAAFFGLRPLPPSVLKASVAAMSFSLSGWV